MRERRNGFKRRDAICPNRRADFIVAKIILMYVNIKSKKFDVSFTWVLFFVLVRGGYEKLSAF